MTWPAYPLCVQCLTLRYCRRLEIRMVSDLELRNSEFVRDVRTYAHSLHITCDRWVDVLSDLYRDFPGVIVGPDGNEAMLDLDVFERPHIREWFKEFCIPPLPEVTPRVRREAWERVRVMATILKAAAPMRAVQWGIRAANENTSVWQAENLKPEESRRNLPFGCPYWVEAL